MNKNKVDKIIEEIMREIENVLRDEYSDKINMDEIEELKNKKEIREYVFGEIISYIDEENIKGD